VQETQPAAVTHEAPATGVGAPTPRPAGGRPPFVPREERERRRREALAGLTVGEWREGKVTGIAAFGAFVDLGGVDGLVHVSQLGSGGFVERVEDVVQVGQVVRVRVVEVDADRGRVSLSMREPRPTSAQGPARERPAGVAPRPPRPPQAAPTPQFAPETPEGRTDRRFRGDRHNQTRDERPRRERSRRTRDNNDDEEWRTVRGDARSYYSTGDDVEEEPAPTTAEELVARFGRKNSR
jgi:small subunit ribosomal protein S1